MNPTSNNIPEAGSTPSPGYYTPGYAKQKMLVILFGLLVAALGLNQMRSSLRLLLMGESALAEATRVIKITPGLPGIVLSTDAAIQTEVGRRQRSAVFWNEFRFHTADGRTVQMRAPVGNHSQPLYPLTGDDGLPTVERIYFDPALPEQAIFPLIVSTWLAPGMVVFCGLLATLIGSFLLYWANKPIELPNLPPAAAPDLPLATDRSAK